MRMIVLPFIALTLIGAKDTPEIEKSPESQPTMLEITPDVLSEEACRDRITQVREAAGKPPLLDRTPASRDRPGFIYAVDKRIDGCAVMVMHGDINDIRPIPPRSEQGARVIPLRPNGD